MNAQTAPAAPSKPATNTGSTYAEQWNALKPAQRKKLMQDAGYQAHHHWSYRAWSFIPFSIREDVIAVFKKQKQASTPKPATPVKASSAPVRKPYWWEMEKELEAVHD